MMKKTIVLLKSLYIASVAICVIIIMLFETDVLMSGLSVGDTSTEFYGLMIAELITICVVPIALWMFRANRIKKSLVADKEKALQKYGSIRILLLAVPMIANTLLYYIFMLPSFGYLAIILFLSLFFVLPTKERCIQDVLD